MKAIFEKIVVREMQFSDKPGFMVLGHELNKMGTVHHFGTRATRKGADTLAAQVKKSNVVYF